MSFTVVLTLLAAQTAELVVLRPGAVAFTSATSTAHAFVVGDAPLSFVRLGDEGGRVRVRGTALDDVRPCFAPPHDFADVDVDAWVELAALARVTTVAASGRAGRLDVVVHPGAIVDEGGTVARTRAGDVVLVGVPLSSTSFKPAARDPALAPLHVKAAALPTGLVWPAPNALVANGRNVEMVPLDAARAEASVRFTVGCVEGKLAKIAAKDVSQVRAYGMDGLIGKRAEIAAGATLTWPDGAAAGSVRTAHEPPGEVRSTAGRTCRVYDGAGALDAFSESLGDAFGALGAGGGIGVGVGTARAQRPKRPAAANAPRRVKTWDEAPVLCTQD